MRVVIKLKVNNNINKEDFYTIMLPMILGDIAHYSNSYPSYDIVPDEITINHNEVNISGHLEHSKEHYLRQDYIDYYPVTNDDIINHIKSEVSKIFDNYELYIDIL